MEKHERTSQREAVKMGVQHSPVAGDIKIAHQPGIIKTVLKFKGCISRGFEWATLARDRAVHLASRRRAIIRAST